MTEYEQIDRVKTARLMLAIFEAEDPDDDVVMPELSPEEQEETCQRLWVIFLRKLEEKYPFHPWLTMDFSQDGAVEAGEIHPCFYSTLRIAQEESPFPTFSYCGRERA